MPDWCVDAALRLSTLGVAVVPVDPEAKKSLIKGFSKWRRPPTRKPITEWWTLAAEQGIASAQSNLGLMYANGKGVPQDDKTAVKWYTSNKKQFKL